MRPTPGPLVPEAPRAQADYARVFSRLLGLLIAFAALAKGAHDFWAATIVYLAALGLWAALLLRLCWPLEAPGISTTFLAPLGCVAAAFSLSFLSSIHPAESWFALMDWLAAMLVFLTAQHVFRKERALRDFLAVVAPVLLLEAAVILYQHWSMPRVPYAPDNLRAWAMSILCLQVPGTLVNSSAATAFLLLWVPVFASPVLKRLRRGRRVPRFWAAGFSAAMLGILSLDSTWGLICLMAGGPFMAGPRSLLGWLRRRPKAAAAAAAALLIAVGFLLWWKFNHAYNLNESRLPPGETTRRLYWWASGLRMFRDRPWLGVGLGNFPSAYPAYKVGAQQGTLYPHNLVIGLLAETGIVGAAALAASLLWWLSKLAVHWDEVEERWPFLLGLLLFASFGMIGLSLEYLVNLVSCAAFLGAVSAPLVRGDLKPRKSDLVVFATLCLFWVPFLVSPFIADRACVDGWRLLNSGDADLAEREFASAAEIDPRSSEAYRGWAKALSVRYAHKGGPRDIEEAALRQRKAIELDSLRGILWRELGDYLAAQGKTGEALESVETAARLRAPAAR